MHASSISRGSKNIIICVGIGGKFSQTSKLPRYQIFLISLIDCILQRCIVQKNAIEHQDHSKSIPITRLPNFVSFFCTRGSSNLSWYHARRAAAFVSTLVASTWSHTIRCLTQASLSAIHFSFAEKALPIFVLQCERLYGKAFLSYNIHGLLLLLLESYIL